MNTRRDLIVFIHGMGVKEPEEYLQKLMTGIRQYCHGKGVPIQTVEDSESEAPGRRRLEVTVDGKPKTMEFQEVYWGDLRPILSSESVMTKAIRGLSLLGFWLGSWKTVKQAFHSKYMMGNMLFTILLLLTWYYGALAMGLTAIGTNPEVFGTVSLPKSFAEGVKELGASMGSWYVWGMASVVMGFLPVTNVINISYDSKSYIQNRRGMYHKICGRLGRTLSQLKLAPQPYDTITILAHSFGGVISTEVLSHYHQGPRVRMITLGSPLLLMAARSDRIHNAIDQVLANPFVDSWVDFFSENDWLCTRSPVAESHQKFESRQITTTVPVDEKITGASHHLYFEDWEVIETILANSPGHTTV